MTDDQSDAGPIMISSCWSEGPTLRIDSLNASDGHSIARQDLTYVVAVVSEGATPVFSVTIFYAETVDNLRN